MIKLSTPVSAAPMDARISLEDKIMVLGSCFADNIGSRLMDGGFDVCVNPFGTLYNPVSICNAVARLESGQPFGEADCVEMGAGAGLICSFFHHTSFARATREEFLSNANASLSEASAFWKSCSKVIISLGTAMVWKREKNGEVVSNCLKRPASEFTHEMLGVTHIFALLQLLVSSHPSKQFIFTVSPIRHMGDGAHANTLSKATLQLSLAKVQADYFPAYEILLDELRDYRFYADDLVHPSRLAEDIIWQRFLESAVESADLPQILQNEKAARRSAHRPIH
ncbi:MAG: GSCFA domain-containing protein [Bacteroidales bacterium]|nr:GSCFA domain-containing protein [Bacteroidales bacterium]